MQAKTSVTCHKFRSVLCDVAAIQFACMMVIEVGTVPHITALLSDVFDIRTEVKLNNTFWGGSSSLRNSGHNFPPYILSLPLSAPYFLSILISSLPFPPPPRCEANCLNPAGVSGVVCCKLSQCSRQAILAYLEPWKGIGGRDLDSSCSRIFHPKFALLSSGIPKREACPGCAPSRCRVCPESACDWKC